MATLSNPIEVCILRNNEIAVSRAVVSDSVLYERMKFTFPESWEGYTKTAVFRNGDITLSVILNGDSDLCTGTDECYIPHEVINFPELTVSVFGILGDSRATTPQATIRVIKSGYGEGDEPSDPTPTEYQQLVNLATETREIAQSVRTDADNGVFKGEKGDPAITDQTYSPTSENAQSGIAVAEAISQADHYEKYFEIIDEYYTATKSRKAIVLKPQYRGATVDFSQDTSIVEGITNTYTLTYCTTNSTSDNGIGVEGSKINSLPKVLYIPETINGETYTNLGSGMFAYNKRIKEVILPKTINQITPECFAFTSHLEKVLNTENLNSLQFGAFFASGIKEMDFSNLTLLDKKAFMKCGHLTKINIGKITAIADRCFEHCTDLQEITHDSGTIITTVGSGAFFNTTALKEVDFLSTLTSIGDFAFSCCAVNFDWSTLSSCTFGNYATPLQMNPTLTSDSYNIKTTSCQLNAPLRIDQENPKWADKPINALETEYKMGCAYFSVMNAYCGILGLNYDNPRELEYINKAIPITVEEVETMVDISSMDKTEVYNNYYGNIVKYIGATNSNYTQNHYYRAGRGNSVYVWYDIGIETPTNIDLFIGNTGIQC